MSIIDVSENFKLIASTYRTAVDHEHRPDTESAEISADFTALSEVI